MDIAFGIVRLFPQGGLQRDCMRLARLLMSRGHRVTIFTSRYDGPCDPDLPVAVIPVFALTNHGVDIAFAKKFVRLVEGRFDRVVGFNKLFGLEMLYCADPSIRERGRNILLRILPRHRGQRRLETAAFAPEAQTHVLALTPALAENYQRHWNTPSDRFTIIPPSIDPSRPRPNLRNPEHRAALRAALGISDEQRVWLSVAAKPQTKGLDRVIASLRHEESAILLVAGVDPASSEGRKAMQQARRAGCTGRMRLLGYREDVPELMAAADLLVHPARLDVTGQVILEAIVNGLPVVVSGICGFAHHVSEADAGIVLAEPFVQSDFAAAVAKTKDRAYAAQLSANGVRYGIMSRPVTGLDVAANAVEDGPLRSFASPPGSAARRAARSNGAAPHEADLISVIVATYNREDALDAVLRALYRQTDRNFEVVVADDGSDPSTADIINGWKNRIGVPLTQVWHPHYGFRAAAIRNRAILASKGRYCIFLDGDCIPRSDFIAAHRELANPGSFVTGNRVLMSRELSDQILRERLQPETWQLGAFLAHWFRGNINRFAPLLRLHLGFLRHLNARRWRAARCANLGVWREDLDRVDGLDARFSGWGLEDSDLLIRLLRAGVARRDGRFATGVLHLWHPDSDRSGLAGNQLRLGEVARSGRVRAIYGLSHLAKAEKPAAISGPVFQSAEAVQG